MSLFSRGYGRNAGGTPSAFTGAAGLWPLLLKGAEFMDQKTPQQNPPRVQKAPQTLTQVESGRLLTQLFSYTDTNFDEFRSKRNYAMALLMLDAGLRVGEVVQLFVTDLIVNDEAVNQLRVSSEVSKSKEDRYVPLTGRLREALAKMHEYYWKTAESRIMPWAFYYVGTNRHLTTRQVERIIKRAAIRAFGRAVHPHILRHTFASRLMRTTNIRVVQALLGHRSIQSTQVYTHPNGDDLVEAIKSIE